MLQGGIIGHPHYIKEEKLRLLPGYICKVDAQRVANMFASPAFPRIPLFSGDSSETVEEFNEQNASKKGDVATDTPPVVPFDSLVLAGETLKSEPNETHKRNAASVAKYDTVAATVKTEEAREFLAALVFLGTRSVSRTSPVAVEKL